jgi:NosR/NirI family nitrous oxide reductase transcriptional regulator
VQAIHPEGHINPNECIQCLHCQMLYHHDQLCPVMIQRRLKREKAAAMASPGTVPPRVKVTVRRSDEPAAP